MANVSIDDFPVAENPHSRRTDERSVPVLLIGGRITASFREALFDTAAREGVSVNEFCLKAAAEKLKASGFQLSGAFRAGDLDRKCS